jgi:hypothetical protein
MITCHRAHLIARCRQRGYTLDEVRPCIVSENGDTVTVDVDHPAYPREPKPGFAPPPRLSPPPGRGPGTELKKLLAGWPLFITTTPTCACNARAAKMDIEEARAPGWCIEHMDEIVSWLREEATKRGLPFLDTAGRLLVRRAVAKAKRATAAA